MNASYKIPHCWPRVPMPPPSLSLFSQMQQQQRVRLHRGSSCPSLLATIPTAATASAAHGYSSVSLASDLYGHHSADSQRVSMSSLVDPQQQQHLHPDHSHSHHHHHHHHRRPSPTGSCNHLHQLPLTEENLKQHTLKSSLGREGRHRRVKYYIESQIRLLRLQADLEGRRMAEMRSLVPLDTLCLEDEVIVLGDPLPSPPSPSQPPSPSHHDDPPPQQRYRRKRGWSGAGQWVMEHLFKKSSSSKHTNSRPASIAVVQQQHRREGDQASRILNYDQYQHEKRALIGQGLSGLSNPNIARALGVPTDNQHQASLASLLFSASSCSSCAAAPPVSSSSSSHRHHHHRGHSSSTTTAPAGPESQITAASASLSYQKRDSGVSVLSKPNHHHRHHHHRQPTSSSITATADEKRQLPQLGGANSINNNNNKRRAQSMDSLVSVRYPKMVHVKILRGAAIHALSSSDMSTAAAAAAASAPTDSIPDCCIIPTTAAAAADKSTCCCAS